MADEIQPATLSTPPPAAKGPTASVRFGEEAHKARFYKVYEAGLAKNKWRNVSEFIWKMFTYTEKNPYGDFPNG